MKKNKNTVKAINRNIRSSPRKINILLKNIRGKKADIAIKDLSFARQRIASEIKKTVQSAIANAENNNQYDIDNLYIKEAYVGKSIILKSSIKNFPNSRFLANQIESQPLLIPTLKLIGLTFCPM